MSALPGILADEALGLSPRIRQLVSDLREEWRGLDHRIAAFDCGGHPPARHGHRWWGPGRRRQQHPP
ncbi:hypothetical protein, partial [Nitrospirillum viridazoti]|uniref:hypothetical protein n=1 Tax=Nitrospirillum viridazoti TaxID=3144925 RepID=UPI0005937EE0